jgi:hypothetical protein
MLSTVADGSTALQQVVSLGSESFTKHCIVNTAQHGTVLDHECAVTASRELPFCQALCGGCKCASGQNGSRPAPHCEQADTHLSVLHPELLVTHLVGGAGVQDFLQWRLMLLLLHVQRVLLQVRQSSGSCILLQVV